MKRFLSLVLVLVSILVLSACSRPPWEWTGCYYEEDVCIQQSRDRMSQIVEALNSQDADGLKGMFSEQALANYSTEIDDGVAYLLSLFPQGDVVWLVKDGGAFRSTTNDYGEHAATVSSSYYVTSGGSEYSFFFLEFSVNEIEPDNIGVWGMGAVPRTSSETSNLEAAFHSWTEPFDFEGGGSNPARVFTVDNGQSSHDRLAAIVDAMNAQDAAALKSMFTNDALARYSAEIDEGLEYLLSLFPDGDIVVADEQGGSALYQRVLGDTRAVLLQSFYRVTSGGTEYRLYFADFVENTIDPENVGIYAIGAVPVSEGFQFGPEAFIYWWTSEFDALAGTPPGIYIPE